MIIYHTDGIEGWCRTFKKFRQMKKYAKRMFKYGNTCMQISKRFEIKAKGAAYA